MYKIVNDFPNDLINATEGPFISLYQPTHRYSPENKQDPIRFKNLIKEVEMSLAQKYPKRDKKPILNMLNSIANDTKFWTYTNEGIAVFYAEGQTIVYKLNRPTKELVVVSDNFHIKPLIRKFQSADNYHALGLNREGFTLFEGNRYGVDEVDLDDDIPNNIRDVLGEDFSSSYITGRYGGTRGQGNYHGHGDKSKNTSRDTEKFFRFVDKAVLDNYSKQTELPLILIALPEYHNIFRKVSKNPYLLDEGIKKNYDISTIDTLKDDLWKAIEPTYLNMTGELVKRFENQRAQSLGSGDLASVAKACVNNQVHTVLIESDRVVPGRVNPITGALEEGELSNPEFGDLLNDYALLTLKYGGKVVMLPKDKMPTTTGVAAIYRF